MWCNLTHSFCASCVLLQAPIHQAIGSIKESTHGLFNVYVPARFTHDGKPYKTTRKTEQDAEDALRDFLSGIGPQRHSTKPLSYCLSTRPKRAAAVAAANVTRPCKRERNCDNDIAGPGRGIREKVSHRTGVLLDVAIKTTQKLATELQQSAQTASNAVAVQSEMNKLRDLMQAESRRCNAGTAVNPAIAECLRKVIALQCKPRAGNSARTKRRLKSDVKTVLSQCDTSTKAEVLESVLAGLGVKRGEKKLVTNDKAAQFIIDSLVHSLDLLKARNPGRYCHNDRVSRQNILAAASCKVPRGYMTSVSQMLGQRRSMLRKVRGMFDAYEAGDRETIHDTQEASCNAYPQEWADFVVKMFTEQEYGFVRKSERMKDDIRNPRSRSDEKLYRIRWRECRYQDMLLGDGENPGMLELGKREFGDGFNLSMKTMYALEPFFVRKAGEETCVCVHHLKWSKLIETLGRQRKLLKVDECKCKNVTSNGHEARHLMMCEREEDARFYIRECIHGECDECPGVGALDMCDAEEQAAEFVEFKREKWMKDQLKDGSDREAYDFFKVASDFSDLYAEISEYAPEILEHHDLATMQDYDWAETQADFPRGHFTSVQDFSMSYRHQRRVRHQSLFFQEVSSTLYGAVLRFHLDDLSDDYISAEEKARLRAGFAKHNENPIITITIADVSADPTHDNAYVQNFNDKLTAFAESIKAPGVKWVCHHARSDGCKAQYKCAQHFYYISRQQATTGIRLDWQFSCSCHGKDLVDPEMGRAKAMAREHENNVGDNDNKSLRTTAELYSFLSTHFKKPTRDLLLKKMRGIYKREVWITQVKGEGAVNRRVKQCDTLDGSSKLHQFEDIGIEGFLRVRERSCHRCPDCWGGRSDFCCCMDMQHYPSELVELKPFTTPSRSLTRSQLSKEGEEMSETVAEGDYICVEVDSLQEPWMIARVRRAAYSWPESVGSQYHWMGKVIPNDRVLWVQKLEGSGNVFTITEKEFPVFVEDVRSVKLKMTAVKTRKSSRLQGKPLERLELCSNDKAGIIASMPLTLDVSTKGKIRETFFA